MSHAHSTYAKIIAAHSVHRSDDGVVIVYADRHIVHPETSAQAFDGLRLAHRDVRRPEATFSPHADAPAGDPIRAKLLDTLDANAHEYHLGRFETGELEEGIVQPGMVVCGHRVDIARFGGIGAVCFFTDAGACEHLLATQTLRLTLPPVMRVTLGSAAAALSAENILTLLVTQAGLPALRSHVLELDGGGIVAMDIDARLRLCAVLSGVATSGTLIAPDEKTAEWVKGRSHAPSGRDWPFACEYWETLGADKDATYDADVTLALPQERSA